MEKVLIGQCKENLTMKDELWIVVPNTFGGESREEIFNFAASIRDLNPDLSVRTIDEHRALREVHGNEHAPLFIIFFEDAGAPHTKTLKRKFPKHRCIFEGVLEFNFLTPKDA